MADENPKLADSKAPLPLSAKSDKPKKKGKGLLIFVLILFLLIGGAAAVLVFDVGGFRENIVMPYIRNAPIIGGFFPAPEEEEPELTHEELMQRYTILTQQLESVRAQLAIASEQVATSNDLIAHLRAFESAWHLYRDARAQMEQMLALGDAQNFVQFFDFVSEDNLVQLYLQALQMAEFIEETAAIVATLNNMDESGAGEVLENLMTVDTQLMVRALWLMSPSRRAEVFDTMDSDVVTTMMVLMAPDEPVFAPVLPPYLPEFPPIAAEMPGGWDVLFTEGFWLEMLVEIYGEDAIGEMPDWFWQGIAQDRAAEMQELFETGEALQLMVEGMLEAWLLMIEEDELWQEAQATAENGAADIEEEEEADDE